MIHCSSRVASAGQVGSARTRMVAQFLPHHALRWPSGISALPLPKRRGWAGLGMFGLPARGPTLPDSHTAENHFCLLGRNEMRRRRGSWAYVRRCVLCTQTRRPPARPGPTRSHGAPPRGRARPGPHLVSILGTSRAERPASSPTSAAVCGWARLGSAGQALLYAPGAAPRLTPACLQCGSPPRRT